MKQLIRVSIVIAIINLVSLQPIFAQSESLEIDSSGNVAIKGNISARNIPVGARKSDLIYWDNGWQLVPPGTENQVLVMRGGVPTWMSLPLPAIGDRYGGGIIFYLFKPGDRGYEPGKVHGLIAHPNDIEDAQWGCMGTALDEPGVDVFSGKKITDIIAANCGSNCAAAKCKALNTNGYNDWYLPARMEMSKLYYGQSVVTGLRDGDYWSSNQISYRGEFKAYASRLVGNGGTQEYMKDGYLHVRPIRAF